MTAEADTPKLHPSVSPTGEQVAPEDADLLTACMSLLIPTSRNWKFGSSHFTYSPVWGKIVRIDFTIPDQDQSPLINRIIFSKSDDGKINLTYAVGQRVEALPPTI